MTKTRLILDAALLAAFAACGSGGGGTHPDAKAPDAAVDAPAPSMDIMGTGRFVDQLDTGTQNAQFNFAMATVNTITPDGAGFDHRTGTGGMGTLTAPVGQGAPISRLKTSLSAAWPSSADAEMKAFS